MTDRERAPMALRFGVTELLLFLMWIAVIAAMAAVSAAAAFCFGLLVVPVVLARRLHASPHDVGSRAAVLPVTAPPVLPWLLCVLTSAANGLFAEEPAAGAEDPAAPHAVELRVERLTCRIGDNRALGSHRAGYNGIFSMASPDQAENVYVPAFAGINLENFFDARPRHPDQKVFFEPRSHPMTLRRINATTVELRQASTPFFGIESRMRFELKSPYYVDYTYTCIPHKPDLAGRFFGVFWASYINAPHDKSVYFLGKRAGLEHPFWEQMFSQVHDRDSTWRSRDDQVKLDFRGPSPALWRAISPLRYSVPFYYGRYRNMVLIYIFRPGPTVRFTISPSGGAESLAHHQMNPAWDFHMVVPNYRVGESYRLQMRAVYKRWGGRADVLDEVRRYLAE